MPTRRIPCAAPLPRQSMTKNRHELPRKKPGRPAKDEIAEDLPTLEPMTDDLPTLPAADDEDLPTLEPLAEAAPADDGPVKVACAAGGEAGFDTVLTIAVPAMDKKAVAEAVQAPLARVCGASAASLRHHKVLVRFTGEAMIGSAVKDLVAETLKPHKPLLAVVRRGFGDETVAQGKLPEVAVTVGEQAGVTKVDVATGELEAGDLPIAFGVHLAKVAAAARGKKVGFVFTGKAKPDATLRAQIGKALLEAGAVRAAIGERVLFDQELAARVRCTASGDGVTIAVDTADDVTTTLEALAMVLPEHAGACKGKVVRITLGKPQAEAREHCVEFARKNGALRVEVGGEIVWPKLVGLVAGSETVLRLQANGRTRPQVLAALRAEAAEHAGACKGKVVVVDWPAGFAVDAEAEACLRDVAAATTCKALVATVAGEQREPFWPEPVAFAVAGDSTTVRIDSEAGKPVELQRAIDRCLPGKAKELRGKSVRVQVAGGAAVSRTLLRGVVAALEAAGVMRLEVEEGGATDVLLPAMLTVTKVGDVVRIAAMTAGRDAAQQAKALQRELDAAALPAGCAVMVGASAAADAVVAAVVAKGAARVSLDGSAPVQVHPPLLGAAEKKPLNVRCVVTPGGDEAMVARQLERELGTWLAAAPSLANQTVTFVWAGGDPASAPAAKLVAACAEKKAAKVLFDRGDGKPQQLHPPVVQPAAAPAAAAAAAAAAAPAAPVPPAATRSGPPPLPVATMPTMVIGAGPRVSLLARRDDAVPPIVVLGVAAGGDADHLAAVQAELQDHLPRFRGRSVLLVLRAGDQDVPVRKADALVDLLRQLVPSTAAATLVFRGPDAQGRPHFQVLHSTLRALPVGATFGDPRTRR